ncbi:MAG: hypothetical protein Sapg2KO_18360 [Saprospiraceae bacterium]
MSGVKYAKKELEFGASHLDLLGLRYFNFFPYGEKKSARKMSFKIVFLNGDFRINFRSYENNKHNQSHYKCPACNLGSGHL